MKRTFTQVLSLALVLFSMQALNAQEQTFTINSPDGVSGAYEFGQATAPNWGGFMAVGESVTANLALVEADTTLGDIADEPNMGCIDLLNGADVAGKIAVVCRGACFFSDKTWYAQEAGAVGVVICNNVPGDGAIGLGAGGDFAGLDTIPTGSISFEDCEALKAMLAAGDEINATIAVQGFVDLTASYAYQTPVTNILPLDSMSVVLYNTSAELVMAEVTWTITDPNGVETSLVTGGEIDNTGARFFPDEAYTPEAVGTYTVTCTNNLNADVLTTGFIITEDVFGIDNGEIDGGVATNNQGFIDDGYIYDAGMLIRTAGSTFQINTLEFGLANWAEITTGAAEAPTFSLVIYNADGDGDGIIPNQTTYDDLGAPVGFTIYTATGEEADNSLVQIDLANPVVLEEAGNYYVMVRYDGTASNNGVVPQYLYGGTDGYYPFNNTPIITDQWYTGWASGQNVVIRSYGHPFMSSNVNLLPANAVTLAPNPTSSELNVAISLETSTEVMVQVIDGIGRVMINETVDNVKETTLTYDVSKYPAGNYYLQVITTEGVKTKSFVKN